jgi:DNA-binding XRE family transcriptional regulator
LITPTQSRMARAALDWPIEAAAKAAGISSRTLLRFENEQRDIKPELIRAVREVYEAAGVRFLTEGSDAGGVIPAPLGA